MIKLIKNVLFGHEGNEQNIKKSKTNETKKLEIATCVLFVEMAGMDNHFDEDEKNFIIDIMKKKFNLDQEYIDELIEISENKIAESDSIYEYTTLINHQFSQEDKLELLKNLWQLIYIDKKLNQYEEQLIKKIGALLDLEYRDVIASKLEVKGEMKI